MATQMQNTIEKDPVALANQSQMQANAGTPTAVDPNISKDAYTGNVQMELKKMLNPTSSSAISGANYQNKLDEIKSTATKEMQNPLPGATQPPSTPNVTSVYDSVRGKWVDTNTAEGTALFYKQTGQAGGEAYDGLAAISQQQEEAAYNAKVQQAYMNQKFDEQKKQTEQRQASEMGQSRMALARYGTLGSSRSTDSFVAKIDKEHRDNISRIEGLRQQAMQAIQNGLDEGSAKAAQAKVAYLSQLRQEAEESESRRLENLQKVKALEKYERESFDATINAWVEAEKTMDDLPEGFFENQDSNLGLPAGTSYALFTASQKAYALKKADVEKKDKKDALNAVSAIYDVLDKIPAGTAINIGGSTYFSTGGTGKIEIDEQGYGRQSYVDQKTGEVKIREIGKIGKEDPGNFERVYKNGSEMLFNKRTGEYTPIDIPQNNWDEAIPPGTRGGQCGSWVFRMTGVRVGDYVAEKEKVVDRSIPLDKADVGFVMVQKCNSPYGHIGIVNGVHQDPTGRTFYTISESNWNLDEKVTHDRKIYADDPRLVGFTRPKQLNSLLLSGSDAPSAQEPSSEVQQGGFRVPNSPLSSFSGTQSQYEKAKQDEQDAIANAQGLIDGNLDLKDIPSAQRGRAVEIAKANGWSKPGEVTIKTPSFEEFSLNMEREMAKNPKNVSFNPQQARQIYDSTIGATPSYIDAATNLSFKFAGEKKGPAFVSDIQKAIESGDFLRAQDKIKKAALDTADTETSKQVRGRDNSLRALESIEKDLAEYQVKGGDTGIFSGTVENIARNVGEVKDAEKRRIATKIQAAIADYRKSISGAAFTESEKKEYDQMFPSILNSEALNSANLSALKEIFKQGNESFYRQQIGNENYDVIFGNK